MYASLIIKILAALPRAAVAGIARKALAILATTVEGATTNHIAHEGEVVTFEVLDGLLAKVEASGQV